MLEVSFAIAVLCGAALFVQLLQDPEQKLAQLAASASQRIPCWASVSCMHVP